MRPVGLICLIGLSACAAHANPPQRTPAPPQATPAPPSAGGAEIVARTNAERTKRGLAALAQNANLMRAAQIHATQMAGQRTMAHDLPGADYPTLSARLGAVGYRMRASAENVAEGHPTAAAVVGAWMTSPGHRDNIVSPHFTEMGAAFADGSNGRRYYVQVFARPR